MSVQELSINNHDKILILAPHPDDESIGTGGILSLFPRQCSVIVLTDGRQGQGTVAPETEKEIRKAEFIHEMKAAGVCNYQMLNYADGTLMQHTDCLMNIPLSSYTMIFVTGVYDGHADHTAACISLLNALTAQELSGIQVYLYEIHTMLRDVTHMLDITNVIEKKMKLIRFHKSQLEGMAYDILAKSMSEYRAVQNRMPGRYIETYQSITPQNYLENPALELENKLQKNMLFYWILTRWMDAHLRGCRLSHILRKNDYQCIAIYGYAEIGKMFYKELEQDQFKVSYIMDKRYQDADKKAPNVFPPQKGLPEVDAVIVTAVYYFDEIKEELSRLDFKNIISFRDLIESL